MSSSSPTFAAAPRPWWRNTAETPAAAVLAGLALFAAVWLLALVQHGGAVPIDDVEQLTWVRSLEWGYYKHPPLPTWLLWLPAQAFGLSPGLAYAAGATTTLAAMFTMWWLLRALRGPVYAGVALLAGLCITYYNGRLWYYNHEVVLLLLSSLGALCCWRAFTTRRWRWWLLLGLALGLGALAKYQVAVTAAAVLVLALQQRLWRDRRQRTGLLLAALVATLVVAPHLWWLCSHDFAPLHYAVGSSLGAGLAPLQRLAGALHWLADQGFNRALPAWALLVLVAYQRRPVVDAATPAAPPLARSLLLAWGGVPLVFMPVVGLLSGSELLLHWGTPFLLWAVPAVMELTPAVDWNRVDLKRAAKAFVVVQALLLAAGPCFAPAKTAAVPSWRSFDARRAAEAIAATAQAQIGGPVPAVIGPGPLASALALALPGHPLVVLDGRYDRSPWIDADTVRRCGALQLLPPGAAVAGALPLDASAPGWHWRVQRPEAGACPRGG